MILPFEWQHDGEYNGQYGSQYYGQYIGQSIFVPPHSVLLRHFNIYPTLTPVSSTGQVLTLSLRERGFWGFPPLSRGSSGGGWGYVSESY